MRVQERQEAREAKRIEMARTRLEKARELAQARLAAAQAELERQQNALENVNEAVMFSMNAQVGESTMLMDAVDVVIKETQESGEDTHGINCFNPQAVGICNFKLFGVNISKSF